jgi:hypothetical protein
MKKTVEVHILQGALDYHNWEIELRTMLMAEGLWTICSGTEVEPTTAYKGETVAAFETRKLDYEKRKYMAMGMINRTLQGQHRRLLDRAKHPKELLEAIKAQFQPNKTAHLLNLATEFLNMKLQSGQDLVSYFEEINRVAEEINNSNGTSTSVSDKGKTTSKGDESTDDDQFLTPSTSSPSKSNKSQPSTTPLLFVGPIAILYVTLNGLPEAYKDTVSYIKMSGEDNLEKIQDLLRSKEIELENAGHNNNTNLLLGQAFAEKKKPRRWCEHCRRNNHNTDQCRKLKSKNNNALFMLTTTTTPPTAASRYQSNVL